MHRLAMMMICVALAGSARAGTGEIPRWTIAAGGGTSQSAAYSLSGTIGQWEAHPAAASASFSVTGGFWGPASAASCPADLSGDGVVEAADLATLIAAWGPAGSNASADLDGDGIVGASDLASLVAAWGACP
jgi:hypothetical protein